MRRRRLPKRRSEWSPARILILAATFLVAAGLGTFGFNAVSRMSQAAAAGLTRTSPDSCERARGKALGKDNDGPATDTFIGEGDGAQTLSECYGAVITEEGKKARDNPGKYGPLQPIEKHYKCTGRENGTVTVDKGIVTSVSMPSGSPSKCPENVVNKGLNDKGKGELPEGDKGKTGEEGKGQEKGPPPMPPMPEKKPKEQQPQDQKCMQDPNAPECKREQAENPWYCSIPGSSLFSSKCADTAELPQQAQEGTDAGEIISDLAASPDAPFGAESSAVRSADQPTQPTVPQGFQRISRQEQPSSESPAASAPSSDSYTSPAFSGFTSPSAEVSLTQEQRASAWWTLEGLRTVLSNWLSAWR